MGRDDDAIVEGAGADAEEDSAAQISGSHPGGTGRLEDVEVDDVVVAVVAGTAAVADDVDTVAVVAVAVDDGIGEMPRWARIDLGFADGLGVAVDTAAAVAGVAADDDVAADVAADDVEEACDLRRHEGYPWYPDAAHFVAASSAAVVVLAADVDAASARGPGVDEFFGGARTTTDEIPDDPLLSIFFFSFSALLSIASLKFLALLSPGLSPLPIASFFALFLSAFVWTTFFPIAFLSAVLLFSFVNSSAVTFFTPSRPAAPFQSPLNPGFFPLLLSPACCSAFLRVQHPLWPISTWIPFSFTITKIFIPHPKHSPLTHSFSIFPASFQTFCVNRSPFSLLLLPLISLSTPFPSSTAMGEYPDESSCSWPMALPNEDDDVEGESISSVIVIVSTGEGHHQNHGIKKLVFCFSSRESYQIRGKFDWHGKESVSCPSLSQSIHQNHISSVRITISSRVPPFFDFPG